MKNNKLILLILSVILTLTVTVIIVSAIESSRDGEYTAEQIAISDSNEVIAGTEKIEFSTYSGDVFDLTYKNKQSVGVMSDVSVYNDLSGNEYLYDQNDNFIGIILIGNHKLSNYNGSNTKKSTDKISEDEAVHIAWEYARNIFGDEFLKLDGNTEVVYRNSSNKYFIRFDKNYGADESILGACCTAIVKNDGSIEMCSMGRGTVDETFNCDLVNDITKNDLLAAVTEELKSEFFDILQLDSTIITLENVDGEYEIKIDFSFITHDTYSEKIKSYCDSEGFTIVTHEFDDKTHTSKSYYVEGSYSYPLEK